MRCNDPLSFLRQTASSSRLSHLAITQEEGGDKYLKKLLTTKSFPKHECEVADIDTLQKNCFHRIFEIKLPNLTWKVLIQKKSLSFTFLSQSIC